MSEGELENKVVTVKTTQHFIHLLIIFLFFVSQQ